MNSERKCSVCFKLAEECPSYATKPKYVIDKLLQLRNNDFVSEEKRTRNISPMAARLFAKSGMTHSKHRPLKAIVFSQFRQVYEYFGDRLIRRFGVCWLCFYMLLSHLISNLSSPFALPIGSLRCRLRVRGNKNTGASQVHS